MIASIIRASIANRVLVLLVSALLALWGTRAALSTPLDAIPDLSDTQVIIRTAWPGQAPQLVEDQVTYPLTTTMLSVPGARTVRGYSMFGDSFVYVIFDDATDLYWARSRVLEYLNQVSGRLPPAARPTLGPDATGVGWIYEYALVDRSGRLDTSQLRAIQDWFLKYELKSVENVAEVASVGGYVRQYQIVLDPDRLRATGTTIGTVIAAVRAGNNEAGGSVLELGEVEYAVRAGGYLKSLDDFRALPVGVGANGVPILLGDVARVQRGPELRRGVSELDGDGEAVGGIIVMRAGQNALTTIDAVRRKIETLTPGLPAGVEIVPTYDRSELILNAVGTLKARLVEEMIIVGLVCALFLLHLRSALVAIVSLPLGILAAFAVMKAQGINANIMSLGGIAIAIGAMVDAAVVMIENAHQHLQRAGAEYEALSFEQRVKAISAAAVEVGPALFFCLAIITLSFVPVFTLQAQEGKLFGPLALTKTYAMAAAAGLSITLIPVLMLYFIRGRIPDEARNPLNRALIAAYRPLLRGVLKFPRLSLLLSAVVLLSALVPITRLGSEFMPPLIEGDLLYMPSALPGLSADKARQLLQQTDRLIRQFPEVERVFGKAGRADTATDPAGLEMFETTIRFKPRSAWPDPAKSQDALIAELNAAVAIPGLANLWVQPIRNRIDMLSTGIKSPVGVKIAGDDLQVIERIGTEIETVLHGVRGTRSAYAERGARRPLHRRDAGSAEGGTARAVDRRCAAGGRHRHRWREHRRSDRWPQPLSDQHPLPARAARFGGCAAGIADRDRSRRHDHARRCRGGCDQRRSTATAQRECAAQRLGLRRHRGPRSRRLCPRSTRGGCRQGETAGRLFGRLVRAVRVSGARRTAPAVGGADHAVHHPDPAVPDFSRVHAGAADHGDLAVRAGRRAVAAAGAGSPPVDCLCRRLHRAGRGCRRVRRDHADLSRSGDRQARSRADTRNAHRGDRGRRSASRAAESDDGGGDRRRAPSDPDRRRHRLGSDAPDRRADGRRHDLGTAAVAVRAAGGLPAVAGAALAELMQTAGLTQRRKEKRST